MVQIQAVFRLAEGLEGLELVVMEPVQEQGQVWVAEPLAQGLGLELAERDSHISLTPLYHRRRRRCLRH